MIIYCFIPFYNIIYNYILSWSFKNVFETYLFQMCFQMMTYKLSKKLAIDHVLKTLKNEGV